MPHPRDIPAKGPFAPVSWPAFWAAYIAIAREGFEAGTLPRGPRDAAMTPAGAATDRAGTVARWFIEKGYGACQLQPADAPITWAAARALGLSPKVRTRKGLLAFFETMGPCTPPVSWDAFRDAYVAVCLADWHRFPPHAPKGVPSLPIAAETQAKILCEHLTGDGLLTTMQLEPELMPLMFAAAYAVGFQRGSRMQSHRDNFLAFVAALGPFTADAAAA